MLDLSGKVAVVTGAGSGIGRGISLALARAGADILSCDISAERAELTATEVRELGRRAHAQQADVRDREALVATAAAAVEQLGGLAICVANAGVGSYGGVLTMTEEEYDTQIAVNQKGVFLTVQACAREMVRLNQGGRIITISSIAARRAPVNAFAYSASKAAVRIMTRSWAQELPPFGITANSIAPGVIETPLSGVGASEAARDHMAEGIPAGRVGQPADIGNLACWLASDESAYVTGTYNVMDGGLVDMAGYLMAGDYERNVRQLVTNRELVATRSGDEILAAFDQRASRPHSREVDYEAANERDQEG